MNEKRIKILLVHNDATALANIHHVATNTDVLSL